MGGRGSVSATGGQSEPVESVEVQKGHLYDGNTFMRRDDSVRVISETLGVSADKALEYREAIFAYSDQYYGAIRAYQRTGNGDSVTRERAKIIEEFIRVSPKWDGGPTYRGIQDLSREAYEQITTPGTVINMRGTSSWSSSKKVAEVFSRKSSDSVIFKVVKQSKGTSIRHISQIPIEDEVLVSKNAKYEVVKVKKNKKGGYTEVELKEV